MCPRCGGSALGEPVLDEALGRGRRVYCILCGYDEVTWEKRKIDEPISPEEMRSKVGRPRKVQSVG